MTSISHFLSENRFCWICRRYCAKSFFCGQCLEMYSAETTPLWFEVHNIPVITLINWNENSSNWIRPLLYSLKAAKPKNSAHRALARYLFTSLYWQNDFLEFSVGEKIYVIPPSNRHRNHALSWALSLRENWGGEIIDPFCARATDPKQKSLKRLQRMGKTFKLKAPLDSELKGKMLILVDDLVTTGYTLKAAYEALGSALAVLFYLHSQTSPPCVEH